MHGLMRWYDWLLVLIPLAFVFFMGLRGRKYVKGVADFLTAGRVAGRYVIAVASGEAGMGLISLVAMFEMYYNSGFAFSFWNSLNIPITLCLSLTGYCVYRFRETCSMTMGQFLEMRYNKAFRIFAATLQSISGVVNYAIFPAVSARCLIYYCDLPLTFNVFGMQLSTFGLIMAILLTWAVVVVTMGGQITIMITDCVQGILNYPMYMIIVGYLIYRFSWYDQIAPTLLDRPAGESMLNPYDISKLRTFNLFYVLVGIFGGILNRMSWCGSSGYTAAAATPHEQKMGGILGTWRAGFSTMMYVLLAICAYTYLNHPNFSDGARKLHAELTVKTLKDVLPGQEHAPFRADIANYVADHKNISPALAKRMAAAVDQQTKLAEHQLLKDQQDAREAGKPVPTAIRNIELTPGSLLKADAPRTVAHSTLKLENPSNGQTFHAIYGQMLVPMAVREILPPFITGIFCAIMIFLCLSTDTTYMHSWGSIIVQDVILPFRSKPFTPKEQLLLLRLVITGVALFAFFFSYFFAQLDFIIMFFAITGAIWLGGAGPCIVFGLYWKRGTTTGAFASLLSGSILAVGGILGQNFWASDIYPWLVRTEMLDTVSSILGTVASPFYPYIDWTVTPDKFPINSQEIYFLAILISLTLYVGLSLLTCRKPFNMDRLLHRGAYRVESEEVVEEKKQKFSVYRFIRGYVGIDSNYTLGDKILAWSVFCWTFGWAFGAFLFIVIYNSITPWSQSAWATWFLIQNLIVAAIVGVISTFWFSIGGILDLRKLFKRLQEKELNEADDGRVVGHVSTADAKLIEKVEHKTLDEEKEEDEK